MRRFLSFVVLLFFTVPFGLSITGCRHSTPVEYCNGGDSGPVVGQTASISLAPTLAVLGESLNYGQIGPALSATAEDCKGSAVSERSFTFATTDMSFADINPSTGQVCAGTWNRNSGGGVPDYTTCTAPATTPTNYLAYVTATAGGATSNALPVYVHPVATGTLIGSPSMGCLITEPVTGMTTAGSPSITVSSTTGILVGQGISGLGISGKPLILAVNTATNTLTISNDATVTTVTFTGSTVADSPSVTVSTTAGILVGEGISGPGIPANTVIKSVDATTNTLTISSNATATATNVAFATYVTLTIYGDPSSNCCPNVATAPGNPAPYNGTSCLSQGQTGQLVARVYEDGDTLPQDNITCQVGHLSFTAATAASVVTIDENGVATANLPGSTTITATISSSGSASTAGFFSTCPPASIVLSVPGQPAGTTGVDVALNNAQPLTTTVTDTQGNPITGLSLEFNSTTPRTIATAGNSVTPSFPDTATITAVCQPSSCNPSPFSQVDLFGNGTPLTSNGIGITAVGTSSTVLYVGSTSSQYLYPLDFTTNQPGSLIKLPFVPNSMVITDDGSAIYLGSTQGLMEVSTGNNSVSTANTNVIGPVLAVSPNDSTLVVTDQARGTVSLISPSGAIQASYGAVATHAHWSPDSSTVYITTTTNQVLVHSTFTGWTSNTADEVYSDVTVTVPAVGAYFSGPASGLSTTEGRSYCPVSTVRTGTNPPSVANTFYPVADTKSVVNDRLAATDDGAHILGATATTNPATLNDLSVALPVTTPCSPVTPTILSNNPPVFTSTNMAHTLPGIAASTINGVRPASNSALAFITYSGTSTNPTGQLPIYFPATGALNFVALTGTAATPVAGVFSTDNLTFFAGTGILGVTSGAAADNNVHKITLNYPASGTPTATDSGVLSPNLPSSTGPGYAPVDLLVQRPKKSQS